MKDMIAYKIFYLYKINQIRPIKFSVVLYATIKLLMEQQEINRLISISKQNDLEAFQLLELLEEENSTLKSEILK